MPRPIVPRVTAQTRDARLQALSKAEIVARKIVAEEKANRSKPRIWLPTHSSTSVNTASAGGGLQSHDDNDCEDDDEDALLQSQIASSETPSEARSITFSLHLTSDADVGSPSSSSIPIKRIATPSSTKNTANTPTHKNSTEPRNITAKGGRNLTPLPLSKRLLGGARKDGGVSGYANSTTTTRASSSSPHVPSDCNREIDRFEQLSSNFEVLERRLINNNNSPLNRGSSDRTSPPTTSLNDGSRSGGGPQSPPSHLAPLSPANTSTSVNGSSLSGSSPKGRAMRKVGLQEGDDEDVLFSLGNPSDLLESKAEVLKLLQDVNLAGRGTASTELLTWTEQMLARNGSEAAELFERLLFQTKCAPFPSLPPNRAYSTSSAMMGSTSTLLPQPSHLTNQLTEGMIQASSLRHVLQQCGYQVPIALLQFLEQRLMYEDYDLYLICQECKRRGSCFNASISTSSVSSEGEGYLPKSHVVAWWKDGTLRIGCDPIDAHDAELAYKKSKNVITTTTSASLQSTDEFISSMGTGGSGVTSSLTPSGLVRWFEQMDVVLNLDTANDALIEWGDSLDMTTIFIDAKRAIQLRKLHKGGGVDNNTGSCNYSNNSGGVFVLNSTNTTTKGMNGASMEIGRPFYQIQELWIRCRIEDVRAAGAAVGGDGGGTRLREIDVEGSRLDELATKITMSETRLNTTFQHRLKQFHSSVCTNAKAILTAQARRPVVADMSTMTDIGRGYFELDPLTWDSCDDDVDDNDDDVNNMLIKMDFDNPNGPTPNFRNTKDDQSIPNTTTTSPQQHDLSLLGNDSFHGSSGGVVVSQGNQQQHIDQSLSQRRGHKTRESEKLAEAHSKTDQLERSLRAKDAEVAKLRALVDAYKRTVSRTQQQHDDDDIHHAPTSTIPQQPSSTIAASIGQSTLPIPPPPTFSSTTTPFTHTASPPLRHLGVHGGGSELNTSVMSDNNGQVDTTTTGTASDNNSNHNNNNATASRVVAALRGSKGGGSMGGVGMSSTSQVSATQQHELIVSLRAQLEDSKAEGAHLLSTVGKLQQQTTSLESQLHSRRGELLKAQEDVQKVKREASSLHNTNGALELELSTLKQTVHSERVQRAMVEETVVFHRQLEKQMVPTDQAELKLEQERTAHREEVKVQQAHIASLTHIVEGLEGRVKEKDLQLKTAKTKEESLRADLAHNERVSHKNQDGMFEAVSGLLERWFNVLQDHKVEMVDAIEAGVDDTAPHHHTNLHNRPSSSSGNGGVGGIVHQLSSSDMTASTNNTNANNFMRRRRQSSVHAARSSDLLLRRLHVDCNQMAGRAQDRRSAMTTSTTPYDPSQLLVVEGHRNAFISIADRITRALQNGGNDGVVGGGRSPNERVGGAGTGGASSSPSPLYSTPIKGSIGVPPTKRPPTPLQDTQRQRTLQRSIMSRPMSSGSGSGNGGGGGGGLHHSRPQSAAFSTNDDVHHLSVSALEDATPFT